jgi:hypothetical protein
MGKAKTYMDKIMRDEKFRRRFDEEYENLCEVNKSPEPGPREQEYNFRSGADNTFF